MNTITNNLFKSFYSTSHISKAEYKRGDLKYSFDTVHIKGKKTCKVKKVKSGEKLLRAIIETFDHNGKKIFKKVVK